MKYLCLCHGDPQRLQALSRAQFAELRARCAPHEAELQQSGRLLDIHSLAWGGACIRPRSGQPVVADGPFAATPEQIGGVFVIDASDLNDAIRIASLHPAAHLGEQLGCGIEIRRIAERP